MSQPTENPITSRRGADQPGRNAKPRRKKRWLSNAMLIAAGVGLGVGAGLAVMQVPQARDALAQLGGPALPSNAGLPETPFLAHAQEAGITACRTVFPILGQLLTGGTPYDLQSAWDPAAPDRHAIRSFVGMTINADDYSGPAAGIVFASPNGSGCEGAMVRVVPYPQRCDVVAAALPAGSALTSNLADIEVYDLASDAGQLLLLPSERSCIAISVGAAAQS